MGLISTFFFFSLICIPIFGWSISERYLEANPNIEFTIGFSKNVEFDMSFEIDDDNSHLENVLILLPFASEQLECINKETLWASQSFAEDYTVCYILCSAKYTHLELRGTSKSLVKPSGLGGDWLDFVLDIGFQNSPQFVRNLVFENDTLSSFDTVIVKLPPSIDQNKISDNVYPQNVSKNIREYSYADIDEREGILRITYPNPSNQLAIIVQSLVACLVGGGSSAFTWIAAGEKAKEHKKSVLVIFLIFWIAVILLGYFWFSFGEWPYNFVAPFLFGAIPPTLGITYLVLNEWLLFHLQNRRRE